MYLLIFEFLGTNEVLVILVVALMLLGPRRLPQMSRKLGKSLADFKRTSEEFKRTWEKEIDMESIGQDGETSRAILPPQDSTLDSTVERGNVAGFSADSDAKEDNGGDETIPAPSVTPVDPSVVRPSPAEVDNEPAMNVPTRKRDWL